MIDLNKSTQKIKDFLNTSISGFQEENEKPISVGIYCCPWAGWLTSNFNISRSIAESEFNCPDFEFVDFDFLELAIWQDEYESDNPEYRLDGLVINLNHDLGDESLNVLVFEYLKPIVVELKKMYDFDFLLQMLDSNKVEMI